MKLHAINHDLKTTLWCGPAALSAVTGRPTSEVHQAIQNYRCKRGFPTPPIKGVSNVTLAGAAELLGFKLVEVFDWCGPTSIIGHKPTLARFLREHRPVVCEYPVIVNVTGHYVTVHRRLFIDNQVRMFTPLRNAPGRRRRVKRAWKVVPVA